MKDIKESDEDVDVFDRKLALWTGYLPAEMHEAIVFVRDTLEISWYAAESVFGDRATPELTLAIYDRCVQRLAGRRGRKKD